jgi:methylated-DNA-[protein]-cysteine S-methyltransferase
MTSHTTRDFGPPFGVFTAIIKDTPNGPALARLAFGGSSPAGEIPTAHAELTELIWHRLQTYFAGDGFVVDDIPLTMDAPPFTRRVWHRLRAIPFGQTETYGSIAADLSSPGASRAVGNACRTNPIPLFVPCHRVLDAAGKLHGYAGGLELKAALLECENAAVCV